MTFAWAIVLLVLLPLAAAALSFAFPRRGGWLAAGAAVGIGVGTAQLIRAVLADGAQIHQVGGWGAPLGIDLRADGLAVWMLLVAGINGAAVALYSSRYFGMERSEEGRHRERYFWPLFLFLWTALNALFLSADIFNLYVTLEMLGFAAVMLAALAGGRDALAAAMRYLLVSLSASLFYLLGVALVYGQCGTVDLRLLAAQAPAQPAPWVALALMTGGLATKTALLPMHFWLPPAHASAPAPVSALLSALVVKGSFYILLRLWFEAFQVRMTPAVAQALGALGAAAILWGSISALRQARLKLLIAHSTVAQIGYLFLLFPLAASPKAGFLGWSGGLILLGAHACAKTAMFLTAGNILHAVGHDRIKDLEGVTRGLPVSMFAFGLSALSLVGLPPSGGFAGKWLLLSAGVAQGQWWWIAMVLFGSLLAAAYVVRVLTHAFTSGSKPAILNPIPPVMEWTALVLAIVAAGFGLAAFWPAELLRAGAPQAMPFLAGGAAP
ncbi:MAG: oxidoreductase [Verrucomicrobia bacterium]|nr:oxidoreductase [Verrucomicrobiota bacterium]